MKATTLGPTLIVTSALALGGEQPSTLTLDRSKRCRRDHAERRRRDRAVRHDWTTRRRHSYRGRSGGQRWILVWPRLDGLQRGRQFGPAGVGILRGVPSGTWRGTAARICYFRPREPERAFPTLAPSKSQGAGRPRPCPTVATAIRLPLRSPVNGAAGRGWSIQLRPFVSSGFRGFGPLFPPFGSAGGTAGAWREWHAECVRLAGRVCLRGLARDTRFPAPDTLTVPNPQREGSGKFASRRAQ